MPDVSALTPFLSLSFLAISIGLIYLLGKVFLGGFRASFGGLFERAAFRRQSLRGQRGDELLEQGDLTGAAQAFRSAFFLKPIRQDASLLTEVGKYHTGLLNRLLTVADEKSKHAPQTDQKAGSVYSPMDSGVLSLPALADTDRLLAERLEIHLDTFRERAGARRPSTDVEPRLNEKEHQLRSAIDRLLSAILSSGEERVVYH